MPDPTPAIHSLWGRWPLVDAFARAAAEDLVVLLVFALAWLLVTQPSIRPALVVVASASLALAIAAGIGALYYVPRPFVVHHFSPLIPHGADSSFPSDHLAVFGAVTGSSWFAARRLSVATTLVGCVLAIARVYVGVHWALDVVGGFVLGMGCGVGLWQLSRIAQPWIRAADRRLGPWRPGRRCQSS